VSAARPEPPHRRARYWRVPHRRRLWVGVVGWTLWALVGLVASVLGGAYIYLDDTLEVAVPDTAEAKAARAATRPVLPGEPTNILLIGSDTRPSEGDPGRSDSLILVRMDPRRDFISMLSFPRDLLVDIPGHGQGKINSAYSYGPATTIETVKQLTGQPVNDYVIVDFAGFEKLVDRVGGVYIDVDRRYFNENIGTAATNYSNIDIQPGYQRLDGADALAYVRYRHTDSTYARDARQQLFLSELKRQGANLGNLTNVTSLRKIFADKTLEMSIENPSRFIKLMNLALFVPKDRIARATVEGRGGMINGASVELADPAEVAAKVALWREPEFVQETSTAKPMDPSAVDVTVLNGSGAVLGAEDVAQALAKKRYRTRVGGNAESFDFASSAVYYADGYRDPARRIAALLGPGATIGALENGRGNGTDVVVVAGADFTGELAPPPKPEVRPPADTVDTTGLVATLREARGQVPGMRVMAPLKVARGSEARIVRAYRVSRDGGDDGPPALKLVFQVVSDGAPKYWGITMTSMKNPPIVEGETGRYTSGGREYRTFYDGRNLQRLAFRSGNTWYWVSNTLMNDLSAKTIEEIAKSMRPLNRATLPADRTDTPIAVSAEAPTP
jgi:LCP family protein required for cell wall assembly